MVHYAGTLPVEELEAGLASGAEGAAGAEEVAEGRGCASSAASA